MKKVFICIILLSMLLCSACDKQAISPTVTPIKKPYYSGYKADAYTYVTFGYTVTGLSSDRTPYIRIAQSQIIAVNHKNKYLVDIDFGVYYSENSKRNIMNSYLTDLDPEDFATEHIYTVLNKDSRHVLIYLTEDQYQKVKEWSAPIFIYRIIDLVDTEEYIEKGYYYNELYYPGYIDIFGYDELKI